MDYLEIEGSGSASVVYLNAGSKGEGDVLVNI